MSPHEVGLYASAAVVVGVGLRTLVLVGPADGSGAGTSAGKNVASPIRSLRKPSSWGASRRLPRNPVDATASAERLERLGPPSSAGLHQIFPKLGVTSRAFLRDALEPLDHR